LRFLVDAQLPPGLARWIAGGGHDAVHVFDYGLHTASDRALWERARQDDAIIVSKDEDFIHRSVLSPNEVRLIWIRKGNATNRALLTWFEPLWPDVLKRLEQGERVIELRA
jgi:predicted nuclease of predicted toxin-antitoxin system